jgi:hypothetical protein
MLGRSTDRLGEQLTGEVRRRRLDELRSILRLRGVRPNNDVDLEYGPKPRGAEPSQPRPERTKTTDTAEEDIPF